LVLHSNFPRGALITLLLLCSSLAAAGPAVVSGDKFATYQKPEALHPFSILGKNMKDCFWGTSTYFHLGAFATTFAMVKTPADRNIQTYFEKENPLGQPFAFAMLRLGDATTFVLGVSGYLIGLWQDHRRFTGAGAAATQAVLLNGGYVGTLKVITGRHRPGETANADDFFPSLDERIDNFRFRHSYPSGHTSSAFAFVASQHAYYPEHPWIPWLGYPIAAAIGIGMVEGDYHWASEVIAGAIIGTTIGYITGRNFRAEYERRQNGVSEDEVDEHRRKQRALGFFVSPTISNGRYAASVTWYW
jgi:membrane-associated phospholipid phosphatase